MKKKKLKRKLKRISYYKKLADKNFSIYIRQRGMTDQGYNNCFTCGRTLHWKELQCGHYVSRSYLNLRYDDRNCHPQCYGCNIGRKGNLDVYALKLIRKYGENILETLEAIKHAQWHWGVMEYSKIITQYGNIRVT